MMVVDQTWVEKGSDGAEQVGIPIQFIFGFNTKVVPAVVVLLVESRF